MEKFQFTKLIFVFLLIFWTQNYLIAGQINFIKEYERKISVITIKDTTNDDSWFSRDKGLHLIGSMMATTLIANISKNQLDLSEPQNKMMSAGVVISLGFSKELFDNSQKNNRFSWKDLVANVAGILLGLAILEID